MNKNHLWDELDEVNYDRRQVVRQIDKLRDELRAIDKLREELMNDILKPQIEVPSDR